MILKKKTVLRRKRFLGILGVTMLSCTTFFACETGSIGDKTTTGETNLLNTKEAISKKEKEIPVTTTVPNDSAEAVRPDTDITISLDKSDKAFKRFRKQFEKDAFIITLNEEETAAIYDISEGIITVNGGTLDRYTEYVVALYVKAMMHSENTNSDNAAYTFSFTTGSAIGEATHLEAHVEKSPVEVGDTGKILVTVTDDYGLPATHATVKVTSNSETMTATDLVLEEDSEGKGTIELRNQVAELVDLTVTSQDTMYSDPVDTQTWHGTIEFFEEPEEDTDTCPGDLSADFQGKAIVAADTLNVRFEPTMDSQVAYTLNRDDTVTVRAMFNDEWAILDDDSYDSPVYASSCYLKQYDNNDDNDDDSRTIFVSQTDGDLVFWWNNCNSLSTYTIYLDGDSEAPAGGCPSGTGGIPLVNESLVGTCEYSYESFDDLTRSCWYKIRITESLDGSDSQAEGGFLIDFEGNLHTDGNLSEETEPEPEPGTPVVMFGAKMVRNIESISSSLDWERTVFGNVKDMASGLDGHIYCDQDSVRVAMPGQAERIFSRNEDDSGSYFEIKEIEGCEESGKILCNNNGSEKNTCFIARAMDMSDNFDKASTLETSDGQRYVFVPRSESPEARWNMSLSMGVNASFSFLGLAASNGFGFDALDDAVALKTTGGGLSLSLEEFAVGVPAQLCLTNGDADNIDGFSRETGFSWGLSSLSIGLSSVSGDDDDTVDTWMGVCFSGSLSGTVSSSGDIDYSFSPQSWTDLFPDWNFFVNYSSTESVTDAQIREEGKEEIRLIAQSIYSILKSALSNGVMDEFDLLLGFDFFNGYPVLPEEIKDDITHMNGQLIDDFLE